MVMIRPLCSLKSWIRCLPQISSPTSLNLIQQSQYTNTRVPSKDGPLTKKYRYRVEHMPLDKAIHHEECQHGAHGLIWFHHKKFDVKYGLMIFRSDGLLDFVGGRVYDRIANKSQIFDTLDWTFIEQVNARNIHFNEKDHLASQFVYRWDENDPTQNSGKPLLVHIDHFFLKQVSQEEFEDIESNYRKGILFLEHTLGVFRVHLAGEVPVASEHNTLTPSLSRFLDSFLRQRFAGTAIQELLAVLRHLNPNDKHLLNFLSRFERWI